jgi:2-C-methyl-D-erythritol 4-phosphate cytidylyltransferase
MGRMRIPAASVILAAAGRGERLGARVPKAFVPLAGRPMFEHSVETLAALPFVREIVLVVPAGWRARVERAWGARLRRRKVARIVAGGRRRQDSVRAGLAAASCPLVLVHDAARPLVSRAAARAVALAAARHGAAVLAAPAVDTVKIADRRGRVVETPERARVWHAQTPQGFRREVLAAAYRAAGRADATDDAQLVERAGGRVVVVPSREPNFKVTAPEDLRRAEALLAQRARS